MPTKKSTVDTNQLAIDYVDPRGLIQHPDNPRRGNVDAILESLLANGQYRALVVSSATQHVLVGNHTLQAVLRILDGAIPAGHDEEAVQNQFTRVAVTYLHGLTAEQEARILAVDNRSADLGTYDDEALVRVLESLGSLVGTGYSDDDLDTLRYITGQLDHGAVLAGTETDAHFSGTDEEREQRAENVANFQGLKAQGLEEVILVLSGSKKEQLIEWLQVLRGKWGVDQTNGELVYAAVGRAVEH